MAGQPGAGPRHLPTLTPLPQICNQGHSGPNDYDFAGLGGIHFERQAPLLKAVKIQ